MAMTKYECDQCGACCRHLIVEAEEIDYLREPKLAESDPHYRSKPPEEIVAELRSEIGKVLVIACGHLRPCHFLDTDNKCTIYPPRPNDCVAMEAGDEQCQSARREAELPPLKPLAPS